jgi:hypothetical protein
MPHKIAIVVEGETEMLFVERLIREVVSAHQVRIQKKRGVGGGSANACRKFVELSCEDDRQQPFFCLIYCSASDSRVASDVQDNYSGWCNAGFAAVVGLRDVYPNDLATVRRLMTYGQRTKPLKIENVLATMEVEAWFLAETSHFQRIDAALNPATVQRALGFDPASSDVETRPHPAEDLDVAYRTVGKRYKKKRQSLSRTVEALDFEELYFSVIKRVPSFAHLVGVLDRFFSGESWNENVPALAPQ